MLRTPQPKEQARLLASLLGQQGITLQHQKALDIVAQLHGHRDWQVMRTTADTRPSVEEAAPAPATSTPHGLDRLLNAAEAVVNNADSEGCSDDLTVTSAQAISDLSEAVKQVRSSGVVSASEPALKATPKAPSPSFIGFNTADVLSVRPDLDEEEAAEVLYYCERYFDASVGLNWDALQAQSLQAVAPYYVCAELHYADQSVQDVVVELYTGKVFHSTIAEMMQLRKIGRRPLSRNVPYPAGTELRFPGSHRCRVMLNSVEVMDGVTEELQYLTEDLREANVKLYQL